MKLIDILVEETIENGWLWPEHANCITQDRDREIMPATCHPCVAKFEASSNRWFLNGSRIDCFTADVLASDYETAIITREQYESALAAKNEGWIEWRGGRRPVDDVTEVDIKFRAGGIVYGVEAGKYYWPRTGQEYDIIAYRLHKPQEAEQAEADDEADLNECIGQDAAPVWNGEGLPPVGCECEYLDSNNEWYPVTIKYASNQIVVICGMTNIFGEEQETEIAKDIQLYKPQFRPIRSEAERKRDEAVQALCYAGVGNGKVDEKAGYGSCWFDVYDAIAAGKIPGVKLED